MELVRRTISIPAWLDKEVCAVWGGMIASGKKMTYSSTMAAIVLGAFLQLDPGYSDETWEHIRAFLSNAAEIDSINADDWLREFREASQRIEFRTDSDEQPPQIANSD